MSTKKESSIELMSAEEFRLKLAGLTDPSIISEGVKENLLNEAVDFVSELPVFYSDDLDRKALWERIGNGLLVAVHKCNGDVELFVNQLLIYIKADTVKVAASDKLSNLIYTFSTRDKAWKESFLNVFNNYHYLVIVKSRMAWNNRKVVSNA